VTGSVGISVSARCPRTSTLVRSADTAMYHAKEKAGTTTSSSAPTFNISLNDRVALGSAAAHGDQRRAFPAALSAAGRPQIGEIAESRRCWRKDDNGELQSPRASCVAEESGLNRRNRRMGAARSDPYPASTGTNAGSAIFRFAVNISPSQLRRPEFSRA